MYTNSELDHFQRATHDLIQIPRYTHQHHLILLSYIQRLKKLLEEVNTNHFHIAGPTINETEHESNLSVLANTIVDAVPINEILYSTDFFNTYIQATETHLRCLGFFVENNMLYADLYNAIQDTTRLLIHLYGNNVTLYRTRFSVEDPVLYHHFAFFNDIINPYKAYTITNKAMIQMGYEMDYTKSSFMLQKYIASDTNPPSIYNRYDYDFGYSVRTIGKSEKVDPIIISIRHDRGVVEKIINFCAVEGMSIDKYAEELGSALTAGGYNVRKTFNDILHIFILIDGPADELDNNIFNYLDRIK